MGGAPTLHVLYFSLTSCAKILQEGTEVTENSKHGVTAPPPSQTLLPSLPSLTSCPKFSTGGNGGCVPVGGAPTLHVLYFSLLLCKNFTGGNRGNGELKTCRTPPLPSLPYLLFFNGGCVPVGGAPTLHVLYFSLTSCAKILQEGTEVTEHGVTAGCRNFQQEATMRAVGGAPTLHVLYFSLTSVQNRVTETWSAVPYLLSEINRRQRRMRASPTLHVLYSSLPSCRNFSTGVNGEVRARRAHRRSVAKKADCVH